MKRYIEGSSWEVVDVAKPLGLVIDAIESVAKTWPCANQVRALIDTAMKSGTQDSARNDSPDSFDLMTRIPDSIDISNGDVGFDMSDVDVGLYMTDDYLDMPFQWNENSFQ